ncbi:S49 family peptidase [Arhodomonas aquaeolei]|uniref:S49 family peptidase n=1 Tax=Arhodomonas aquaeolei TaxID=2369 RepID=UPI002166E050|nr:S49 family peptidase [Arhodomonas aquaeolei]MCS4503319.1 S49 family peptidase [Arhodomonas aquaeolei]
MATDERDDWAQATLRDIALEGIRERRRARRWGLLFKFLLLAYLVAILLLTLPSLQGEAQMPGTAPHTAVVDLDGTIAADTPASADRVINGLEEAFSASGARAVMLRINSPGGSPVQARRIYAAIQRLRAAHPDKPLYAVTGDIAASGAYYVAAAADRIYADPASLVGSIGVIMGGFGYTGAMEKLGIERRLYTAGRNKAMLDPFSETNPAVEEHVQSMLEEIHQQFIDAVKQGRGDRLASDRDDIFSGLVWTGARAVDLGLADALATPDEVARDVVGVARTVDYTPRGGFLERVMNRLGVTAVRLAQRFGGPFTGAMR